MSTTVSMAEANVTQRQMSVLAVLLYALGALLLLPWAMLPGYAMPHMIGVYGAAIAAANLITAALLARQYRKDGYAELLLLALAHFYGTCLVSAHALTFPDAFRPGMVFGHEPSANLLFQAWRLGTAACFLAAVLVGTRAGQRVPHSHRGLILTATLLITALLSAALIYASVHWQTEALSRARFTFASLAASWCAVLLYVSSSVLIFVRRAHRRRLFLWVALVVSASAADLALTTHAGARFTLGWYVGRCGMVISSYLLLTFLLTDFARDIRDQYIARTSFTYLGAIVLAVAATLLRYFLTPWLGTTVPYVTLFGAVGIAVWMGGFRPAIVTALLGFYLSFHFIAHGPVFDTSNVLGFVLYALSCAVMIALGENMRRARLLHEQAEARFRGSHEASVQGFALLSPVRNAAGEIDDFIIDYINPLGAEYSNGTQETLHGRRMTQLRPNTRGSPLLEGLTRVAQTGAPLDLEVTFENDGIRGWFRNLAVRVGTEHVALSFSDITRSKQLEHALTQRAAELERVDSNKRQFLATLSHELRNPMAPLRNGLAVLRMRKGGDNADVIALMERQLAHLVRLVDDLLDVSRIDRGKIDLRRERVLVDTIVRAAIDTARPMIDAQGHELVVRLAHRSSSVEGDPVRLAQVVSNLLINAAKFTPRNGRIELSIEADEAHVTIRIADNGVGIEPEQLERIFEMFVQLDASKTQATAGLGLGLALVRSLVQLHGGRVEAHSAGIGKGAQFTITLPKAADAETSLQPANAITHEVKGRRIAVVDDNVDSARTLALLLEAHGHGVDVYADGACALEGIRRSPVDIAFVDLNMPRMDGFELARRLRAALDHPPRLIALTGMGQPADIERTRACGFERHITKPANPEVILQIASAAANEDNVVALRGT